MCHVCTLFMRAPVLNFAAVPLVFVLIPLIVDLATGYDPVDDIVVRRTNSTEDISL